MPILTVSEDKFCDIFLDVVVVVETKGPRV